MWSNHRSRDCKVVRQNEITSHSRRKGKQIFIKSFVFKPLILYHTLRCLIWQPYFSMLFCTYSLNTHVFIYSSLNNGMTSSFISSASKRRKKNKQPINICLVHNQRGFIYACWLGKRITDYCFFLQQKGWLRLCTLVFLMCVRLGKDQKLSVEQKA